MFEILIASCGAFVFVNIISLHRVIGWMNRKPFACEVCMAGWFSLITCIGYSWYLIPFMMSASMVLTIIITTAIKKL